MTVSRIFVNNLHNYVSVQTRGNIRVNYKYLDVINNADLRKRNFEIMSLHSRGEPGRPNCKHQEMQYLY